MAPIYIMYGPCSMYMANHKELMHTCVNKVRAHTGIKGNEIADTLANEGTLHEKPTPTPHIHLAHASPYWLASCPTATHDGAIRNLHTFVTKAHDYREVGHALIKFPYVKKWLSNTQINQKLSNHFWKNKKNNGRSNHPNPKIPIR